MKNPEQIKAYSPSLFSKFSNDLFRADTRFLLSLNAQKLLFGLCCSLTEEMEHFPKWEIHISELFSYLNLKGNSKYDIVRESLNEIIKIPLEIRKPNGSWETFHWFNYHAYDADSKIVSIAFNDNISKYLLQLTEYCKLEIQYYINLNSKYALFLYPRLRAIANQNTSVLKVSVSELKEITYSSVKDSYTKSTASTANFLRNVIGIQKVNNFWIPCTRINKKTGETESYGAIHEINKHSDLYVTCEVKKKGRVYDEIHFHVSFKSETYEGKRKEIRRLQRIDFKDEATKKIRIQQVKNDQLDLFPQDQFMLHPIKDIEESAKALNITLQELITRQKLKLTEDGKHFIRCTYE